MTSTEHCALAQRLNDATRDGRLDDTELVALRAGFTVLPKKNRREFFKHLQNQLSDAAQARIDGYGLNAARGAKGAPARQADGHQVPAMQTGVSAKTSTPKPSP